MKSPRRNNRAGQRGARRSSRERRSSCSPPARRQERRLCSSCRRARAGSASPTGSRGRFRGSGCLILPPRGAQLLVVMGALGHLVALACARAAAGRGSRSWRSARCPHPPRLPARAAAVLGRRLRLRRSTRGSTSWTGSTRTATARPTLGATRSSPRRWPLTANAVRTARPPCWLSLPLRVAERAGRAVAVQVCSRGAG